MSAARNTKIMAIPLLAAGLFLALASGCAFSPVNKPQVAENDGVRERVVKLGPERAFTLAALTAKSLGYKLLKADRDSGRIITVPSGIPLGGNADCGTWNGTPINGMGDSCLFIDVSGLSAGKSRIKVQNRVATTFRGRNLYGMVTRQETMRCSSLGNLEEIYMDRLREMAKQNSPSSLDSPAGSIKPDITIPKPTPKDMALAKKQQEETQLEPPEQGKAVAYHTYYVLGIISKRDYQALKAGLQK